MKISFLFTLLCGLVFSQALYIAPELPSEDKFYDTPDNIEDYALGEIIRHRDAPTMIRSIYVPINVKNAWQFLVRSTDSRGNATAIVTTILEPYDADPTKLWSYQYAEDSPSIDCSPSYTMLFGAKQDTLIAELEMILVETGLSRGWYVVAPDYEGVQGSFTAGKQAGHATLDSIRAALSTNNVTGISPDAEVAMFGYSGGTIATGWAANLQPTYAPDLKGQIIGAAMGGWVTNITLTARAVNKSLFAGLIPLAINGLLQEYPELEYLKEEQLEPDKYALFEKTKDMCLLTSILRFAFVDFFTGKDQYVKSGWGFFDIPAVQEVVSNNTLALHEDQGYPEIPIFVFHGTEDEVVPFSGAQRVYEEWCAWGIDSFEFAVSNTTGHVLEVIEGSSAAITWLENRFAGKEPVKGCTRTVRETNLEYPGSNHAVYQLLSTLWDGVLGKEIGDLPNRNKTTTPELVDMALGLIDKLLAKIGPIPLK